MVLTGNLHVATSGKRPGTPRSLRATCHGFCHKNEKNNVLTPSGLICAQGRPDKRDSVWCPAPVYCTGLTASKQMTPTRHFREMLMLFIVCIPEIDRKWLWLRPRPETMLIGLFKPKLHHQMVGRLLCGFSPSMNNIQSRSICLLIY